MNDILQFDSELADARGWIEDAQLTLNTIVSDISTEQWPEPQAALWALEDALRALSRARAYMQKHITYEQEQNEHYAALADAASY